MGWKNTTMTIVKHVVTKKDGPTETRSPNALSAPGPWLLSPLLSDSHPCVLTQPQTITSLLMIWLQFDRPINTLLDSAHTSHKIFSHRHITKMLAFHSQYIHAPKAQAGFFNTKMTTLIVLGVLVPLLHPPLSCNTNLATYQTQRKIQDIAEVLSYKVLLFSSPSISLQNHLALLKLRIFSCLRSIFLICCLSSTICSLLQNCLLPTDFWSFFSKGPLLLPEASPKRSVPIQSNPGSAVLPL